MMKRMTAKLPFVRLFATLLCLATLLSSCTGATTPGTTTGVTSGGTTTVNVTDPTGSASSSAPSGNASSATTTVSGASSSGTTALSVPAYSGQPYVVLNGNQPVFSEAELTTTGYETYSALDGLGRCGVALASCGREIMPADGEQRGDISHVYPTGWVQATYNSVSGKYLYNRSHLIGWQLSAENDNPNNLITGTRYFNTKGMLPFENMIADYVRETGHHVAYRVTPIYEGNNLLASGVEMEAYSVEDDGEGICFHVYVYNVQQGIVIDYATGSSHAEGGAATTTVKTTTTKTTTKATAVTTKKTEVTAGDDQTTWVWIPQTGSKYHYKSSCSGMKDPKQVTLEEAIQQNYEPCKKCCK